MFASLRSFAAVTTLGLSLLAVSGSKMLAQFAGSQANATPAGDKSPLRPPAGARVAIYEFEDLECPFCAYAAPS